MPWLHTDLLVRVRVASLLMLIATVGLNQVFVRSQNSQEELNEPISIIIEIEPHSLRFQINDTETYALLNVTCRNNRGVETMANEDFVCENLEACTQYLVTVYIQNIKEENPLTFEKTYDNVTTEYYTPQVEITGVESGVDRIILKCTATDQFCISYYQIEAITTDKDYKLILNNHQDEIVLDGLSPCQNHTIHFKAYDKNNDIILNWSNDSTTEYLEPGDVTNIVINTTYDDGQAKVTWDSPQYSTCIEYYYIRWFFQQCDVQNELRARPESVATIEPPSEEPNCTWSIKIMDFHTREYVMSNLDGCETYGLQFFINSETNAKSEVEQFTAAEKIPGLVSTQEPEINETEVTLLWGKPKENSKCVQYYEVEIQGPLQKEPEDQEIYDTATTDTFAKFEDLEPCGHYNYTIRPVSLNNTKGNTMSIEIVLLEGKPSIVRNPVIIPEPNTLHISWEKPAFAELCINVYRLSIWPNGKRNRPSIDKITEYTNATVDNLYSCESYTVQIIPETKSAEDGYPSHTETETAPKVAQAPVDFQSIATYSDGFDLSASNQDLNNACETIFARFSCIPNVQDTNAPKKSAERNVEGKVAGTSFRAALSPLSPFTEYACVASFFNVAGWSPEKLIIATTRPYYSDMPESIIDRNKTSSSIIFTWQEPRYPNGNIIVYISRFQRIRPEYFVPPHCAIIKSEPIDRESSSREQPFYGLLPYTRYSIQVAAKNQYGLGEYTRPYTAATGPAISEPITNLKMTPQGPYESDEEYLANVLISWTLPCKSNGQIESFQLSFLGERNGNTEFFTRSVWPEFDDDGVVLYNLTELKPEYNYAVTVAVRTVGVEEPSAIQEGQFVAPAGIPKRFNETTVAMARVNAYDSNNPTNSAVVRFPAYILDSEEGTIVYAAILLSERGCGIPPSLAYGALNSVIHWPSSRTWNDVYVAESDSNCIQQYQTTQKRWKPEAKPGTEEIEFIIGTDKCDDTEDFCNGPLKPDTEFYLIIRLFTKSGYNDAVMLHFHTDALIQLTVIVVSICCVLFLAFFAGFLYIYITKRMQWKRQSYQDIEDPFGDIMAKNFATYFNEVSKPERIAREYKELTMVAMDFSYAASELGCCKNRYADIYPYDKNRVILDIDAEGSDYINASFIDGYRRKKEYIATQGPKPESTIDFWRMILQHNIRVIVMVTQFREGDTVKCHEYFPFKSQAINVTVKKKETFELYDRSEITVSHDRYGLKQKVVHFYFKKWPDHGCPVDSMHLISFVRKVKAEKVPSYSSIVVHCSAGVGRTGTFIALDIIMQRLKSESKINIYGTVKKLRFQRMKMVQTLEQYTFLYKCAYELVKHKNQKNKNACNNNNNNNNIDNNKNKSKKHVTFQEEPESNLQEASNHRIIRRQSELSAIDENELESRNDEHIEYRKPRDRPHLKIAYNSSGQKKGSDSRYLEDDTNESVM